MCLTAICVRAQTQVSRGPALNWVRLPGADGCIAAVELANRVEQRLGRRVFTRVNDAILVIEGRVGPAVGGGFSAVLRVSDPDGTLYGTRELTSATPDCRALDDVAALIIAITIRHEGSSGIALPDAVAAELDALFADEPSTLDPSALPPPPSAAEPEPLPATSPPTAAEAPARLWYAGVELALDLATGIQPRFAAFASLRATLRHATLGMISVSGLLSIPQLQTGLDGAGELEHRLYALGLGLCLPLFPIGSSALGLCAEGRVGELLVTPTGFASQQKDSGLWVELAPRATLRVEVLRPAYVMVGLALPIRLRAPEFRFTDRSGETQVALDPARLGLEGELGFGVEF